MYYGNDHRNVDSVIEKFKKEFKLISADGEPGESLACLQMIAIELKLPYRADSIEKILNGDKELLKKVTKDQFCGDKSKMIISRCIMNEVVTNKEWLKKNNLGVEWYE